MYIRTCVVVVEELLGYLESRDEVVAEVQLLCCVRQDFQKLAEFSS